jgi:hypothetical protein
MRSDLPTCKFCGTKLVDRGHFKNRKAYDYFRRFSKCQKCQDWDEEGRRIVANAIERRKSKKAN